MATREAAVNAPRGAVAVLWTVPAVYFVFVGAEFALMTHLALALTAAGRSALAVGALGTALWAGILGAALVAHHAVQRVGSARVLVGAVALALLACVSLALVEALPPWLAGAFLLGAGSVFVWVAGEAWLAEAAPPARRGLLVGAFETAVGLGMMVGPALVPLTRAFGWSLPWLSVGLMAATLVLCAHLLRHDAGMRTPAAEAASAVPWLLPWLGVALLGGLMESGVSALWPSIGMRLGLGIDAAALLGTAIGAGSALLQPPAGALADRIGTRRALLLAWLAVLVACAALAGRADAPGAALGFVGFALGGVGGAVYTLVVVELGHRLRGAALVRAVGALVIAYAAGTVAGPLAGGALFDAAGLRGLALALLLLAACGLGWTAWRLQESAR